MMPESSQLASNAVPWSAWAALGAGAVTELAMVAMLRASKGNLWSWQFGVGCLIGCVSCACVALASRHFPAAIVYTMWVGLGGLLITLTGMFVWNEPRTATRIAGTLLVLGGLMLLKLTLRNR